MNRKVIDALAVALGGTASRHMDAVQVIEALDSAGFVIIPKESTELMPTRIELIARVMTKACGRDPDEKIPRTGYPEDKNNLIPRWYFCIEPATMHIAATIALKEFP